METLPLVIIVGPTASGKSAVAEHVAEFLNVSREGGVVNADARQVYAGLHTLVAAPEPAPHRFLYEFLNVAAPYSFAQYVVDADAVLKKIFAAGGVPVVVGGSGLYVDALMRRTGGAPRADEATRAHVASLSFDAQKKLLREKDPAAAATVDMKNPRRVSRALEVFLQTGNSITAFRASAPSPYRALYVGWTQPRAVLHERIAARAHAAWDTAVAEVRALGAAGHTPHEPGMKTIGVPEIISYLDGRASAETARAEMITHTCQYARRQRQWFRRTPGIVWYTSVDEVCRSVHDFLQ